jgi:hypothetical protein
MNLTKPGDKAEWKMLLKRYKLMENVHGETGANQIFTITTEMVKLRKWIIQIWVSRNLRSEMR